MGDSISLHERFGSGRTLTDSELEQQRMIGGEGRTDHASTTEIVEKQQTHGSVASGTEHANIVHRSRHTYTIRRPRALQFSYRSQVIHHGEQHIADSAADGNTSISAELHEEIAEGRERLDLFIDLIWVGIIGNLSEVFSSVAFRREDPSPDLAFLLYIMVFLPSWRIWDVMREFLNNYYMDDVIQRKFVLYILILSVFFGNQLAYLTEDVDVVKRWLITAYLLILGAFFAVEMVYSIFIPWLRKLMFWTWMLRAPGMALWVVAINLDGLKAVGPVFGAIVWEYLGNMIVDTRVAERFMPVEYRKALDVEHFQKRMANFFIIILGEGVLLLVKDGPLGQGLTSGTGTMAWVLVIYYELSFLYFNVDGSRKYLHAVQNRGPRMMAWVFFHIPLFASILTFAAGVMFIVRNQPDSPYNSPEGQNEETIPAEELPDLIQRAVWTCASALGVIMLSLTILALLNKPLDEPDALKINNRYARLSMRVVFIVVVVCLPLIHHVDTVVFLGIASGMILAVTIFEWNVSLEKNGGLIEPKGLTHMLSRELKPAERRDRQQRLAEASSSSAVK